MKIIRIISTRNKYGGRRYEDQVSEALAQTNDVTDFNVTPHKKRKYFFFYVFFINLLKLRNTYNHVITIRSLNSCFFLSSHNKNIIIAHHFSTKYSNLLSKILQLSSIVSMLANRKKIDCVVVVSRFWERFFSNLGFKNIRCIYNCFDVASYTKTLQEVDNFKKKYNLPEHYVYIGNAQKKKGVDKVFKYLQDSNYYLVTSGKQKLNLPIKNLSLDFDEYKKLLTGADTVIALSQFKEGWCRTAHEALLCKTPVIGSGKGGMYELLSNAGQIICSNPEHISDQIHHAIQNRNELGQTGYQYASKFTYEKFKSDWTSLINDI